MILFPTVQYFFSYYWLQLSYQVCVCIISNTHWNYAPLAKVSVAGLLCGRPNLSGVCCLAPETVDLNAGPDRVFFSLLSRSQRQTREGNVLCGCGIGGWLARQGTCNNGDRQHLILSNLQLFHSSTELWQIVVFFFMVWNGIMYVRASCLKLWLFPTVKDKDSAGRACSRCLSQPAFNVAASIKERRLWEGTRNVKFLLVSDRIMN